MSNEAQRLADVRRLFDVARETNRHAVCVANNRDSTAEWRQDAAKQAKDADAALDAALVALAADSERLDFLIDWLGHHDDLEGSGVRDWDDSADARAAIDAAMREAK